MNITITNTIKIIIGDQELVLSKFSAETLYAQLGTALGKNEPPKPAVVYRGDDKFFLQTPLRGEAQ